MKPLSSKDICAIIKECGLAKVSSLKLGELAIDFNPAPEIVGESTYTDYSVIKENLANIVASEKAPKTSEPQDPEYFLNLALENPQQYEELISRG